MTLAEAHALQADGQHRAEAGADMRVVALVDAAIEAAAAAGSVFSANTIRAALPTTTSPGLIGGRIRRAANRNLIQACGFEQSTLTGTRGAYLRQWVGRARPA